jgi:hypothetical protein
VTNISLSGKESAMSRKYRVWFLVNKPKENCADLEDIIVTSDSQFRAEAMAYDIVADWCNDCGWIPVCHHSTDIMEG